ncbi:cytochrome P450 [Mycobacterium sp. CBMA293]|uniref:cytochrome P450 n=1 Tax=unclassified Mycolicibacterium TaxID=2636767 RepID=UPI001354234F|nr:MULTISPECIES: cytochrome P450 [unclassified Mycolicibacterium]MUL95639.1 cytochrome P450 [Mycolicibacterium sp. CBMA 230]MUM33775.1 cytochrome P450 [Mycolicibacterium sp. CBMA 361]MUL57845.1 cytochrome P450 [Mycolicibacterium sp. CBMA 335]MUL72706.1 cytochrome P450 [Mycolicibacterium sp. CBMA 311]MUM07275.1 cytochrome [Mycolicibacterium sp. CBMA 213]
MQLVSSLLQPSTLDDPYSCYAQLRAAGPVHQVAGTNFYLATTWDAVQEAVSRPEDFSSNLTATLVNEGTQAGTVSPSTFDMGAVDTAGHVLATGDDPRHAHERKLVLPALVAKRIRALEPVIADISRQLWHTAAVAGHIEWMDAIGDRLPMTLVARLIGLPDDDVAQLVQWGYGSTELLSGVFDLQHISTAVETATQLAGYLYTKFAEAQANPGDDLLGDLARAVAGGILEGDAAVLMLIQLVGAGGESTAGLMGNAARLLATVPDVQEQVRGDPQLLPALLEETLRLESPFRNHHRHIRSDTALAGVPLPEDGHLLLLWGSANRDPAAFDDPDALRLDRPNLRNHLAFGKGLHFCVGAALARTEARIAITTLLEATDWFDLVDAEWVPSLMVRRHRRLELRYR